jgi:hypothetical protein
VCHSSFLFLIISYRFEDAEYCLSKAAKAVMQSTADRCQSHNRISRSFYISNSGHEVIQTVHSSLTLILQFA